MIHGHWRLLQASDSEYESGQTGFQLEEGAVLIKEFTVERQIGSYVVNGK